MRIGAYVIALVLLGVSGLAAAEEGVSLRHMDADLSKEALKKGARTFVNHCFGCHSLSRFRYRNLVDDLGMAKQRVEEDLMHGTGSLYSHMGTVLSAKQAQEWLGAPPPDLSLVTRVKGNDWVYSYLLGFYRDPKSPDGWDNRVFPQTAMPNVPYHMTENAPDFYEKISPPDHGEKGPGTRPEPPPALHAKVKNLVSFLVYASDPSVLTRYRLGPWVLGFLAVLGGLTYWIKREYWRDVH